MGKFSLDDFQLVYNLFSLAVAAMLGTFVFLIFQRRSVAPAYRTAITLAMVVVFIAAYHYLRIFDSWSDSFSGGFPFNEGYRYVDWLITVPLLLAELVLVLRLDKGKTKSLITRLASAAVLMILLGYPGEMSPNGSTARIVWGIASLIPFLYILYVLFVEMTKSLNDQPAGIKSIVSGLRWIILITWSFYPVAYFIPVIDGGVTGEVIRQSGYSIADILAKPAFCLLVYLIARRKSAADNFSEAA